MLQSIKQAKHFIYIENQYFIRYSTREENRTCCLLIFIISSTAGGKVKNLIGEALIMRIRQAIIEKRMNNLAAPMFRVIVVLPVHPEGTYKDSNSIRCIKNTKQTKKKGKNESKIITAKQNEKQINYSMTMFRYHEVAIRYDMPRRAVDPGEAGGRVPQRDHHRLHHIPRFEKFWY